MAIGLRRVTSPRSKTYATFGLRRSLDQVIHVLKYKPAESIPALHAGLHKDAKRMRQHYGAPLENLDFLEIGPGQGQERAHYFGIKNDVVALDLDVIPHGLDIPTYWRMLRTNGVGRVLKTVGRQMLLDRRVRSHWIEMTAASEYHYPQFIQGDICDAPPFVEAFDVVMSWSVFEHVSNPESALRNVIEALRPGGIFYISIHLYTSNNGHHDIRSFTGRGDEVPLWGHLRESTRHLVNPSAYLNEWRLQQWRALMNQYAPGYREYLEQYEHPEVYGPSLLGPLRTELADYDEIELLTVNAIFAWKKPTASDQRDHQPEITDIGWYADPEEADMLDRRRPRVA